MANDNDTEMNEYPSPANPLAALGIDPDETRSNPDIMAQLAKGQMPDNWRYPDKLPADSESASTVPVARPTDTMAPLPTGASKSAETAGAVGGAGVQPATDATAPVPPTPAPAPVFDQATGGEMHSARELERLGESQSQTDPTVLAAQKARDQAMQAQTTLQGQASDKQYQPSLGRRIWRGVRGGLEGLAIGGIPGAVVGALDPGKIPGNQDYSAPNAAYEKAAGAADQNVKSSQASLDEAAQNFKTLQDARSAGAKTINDARTGFGGVATQQVDQSKAAADAARAANETPDAKAKAAAAEMQGKLDVWDKEATRLGLQGQQATFYRANGRIFDPRQATAEEIARSQALSAWQRENPGKKPSLDDLTKINAAAAGKEPKGGDDDSDKAGDIVAEAINQKTAFQQQYNRNDDGTYTKIGTYSGDPKSTITGQEYGAKVDEFRTKANKSLDKMGYEWNEQGNLVQKGDKKTASGSPPPRPTVPPIAGATGTALNRATNKWHWTDGKKDMGEVQGQ